MIPTNNPGFYFMTQKIYSVLDWSDVTLAQGHWWQA
jgi:hypothetical protein